MEDYKEFKILMIDDDKAFGAFVTKIVDIHLGAKVVAVNNPSLGFKELGKDSYDLILLDMEMPVMDGHNTLKQIRTNKSVKDIPVIVCTALSSGALVASLAKMNIDSYIIKPTNANILIDKIKTVFDKIKSKK